MAYYSKEAGRKWSVRFREVVDGIEKQRRLSGFPTKKAAEQAYIDYQAKKAVENNQPPPANVFTYSFQFVFEQYYADLETRAKNSTLDSVKKRAEGHILPYFGKYAIGEITPLMVNAWQKDKSNLAFEYRKSIRSLLSSIFKFGARLYGTPNPMSRVSPLRNTEIPTEMQVWSLEEFQAFYGALDSPLYQCYFSLLFFGGLRKHEALALQWQDIHPPYISVTKTVTRKTVDGSSWALQSPKTKGSVRKVSMPDSYFRQLYALEGPHNPKDFIFSTNGKAPLFETAVLAAFLKAIKASGVKRIRIHDLRHSCASYLISKGVSIVAVAKRLGHENIEMTLNTYSHLMHTDDEQILSAIPGAD